MSTSGSPEQENEHAARPPAGRVFWPLMAVSAGAVAVAAAVVGAGRVLERLRHGPSAKPPVTDLSGKVHPGEPRVYIPRDSWAQDQERDG